MNQKKSPIKGFTLVELAVSLVVIGLLIGLGTAMVGPLMTAIKVRESKETIGGVVESVNSWASGNNRLPDSSTGNSYSFANVAKSPKDSWGRDFIYLYDQNFTTSATKDTICGRRSTALTLKTNPAATISNVAYVILSASDDADIQTTILGTIGGTTYATNTKVPLNTLNAATGTITTDVNNSDIVRWVTLDELRTKVGCQGAQLRIVNNELPYGSATGNYSAIISAEGGVPIGIPDSYRWCIQPASGSQTPSNVLYQKPDSSGTPVAITNVTNINQADCLNYLDSNWPVAGKLLLSWTSTSSPTTNSYSFTVFVRDNSDTDTVTPDNDNIAKKSFVLTVNP